MESRRLFPIRPGSRDETLRNILRTGPKEARELLALSGLSKRTLYHRLGRLEKEDHIAVFPLRQRDRWAGLYCLPEHAHLAAKMSKFEPLQEVPEALQSSIRGAVETLRRRLLRNPDFEEIAAELRENPESNRFRRAVYQTAVEVDWRPPTPREVQEAADRLKRILVFAGLLKRGIAPPEATPDDMARAREYLAEHPELVPELRT